MKHLVLVTSVIKPKNSQTIYSEEQRFSQLLDTLKSAQKIPSNMIIVLEGTKYSEEQEKQIRNLAHDIFYVNVDKFDKQLGEITLLGNFISSEYFKKIKSNILSINKLSGRYTLTENFKFYYDGETCVSKIVNPHESYSGKGFILTRYYSIPIKYYETFLFGLMNCYRNLFINIEHSFYLHNVIPINKINRNITKINVCGNIAPNGEYVED